MKHFTLFPRDATAEQMVAQVDAMIVAAQTGKAAAKESAAPSDLMPPRIFR
jgi:hypothetical protein